jgi:hypothetical protein
MKIRVNKTLLKERIPKNDKSNKRNVSLELDKKDIQLLFKPINFSKKKNINRYENQDTNSVNKRFSVKSVSPQQSFYSTPKSSKNNILYYDNLKDANKPAKERKIPLPLPKKVVETPFYSNYYTKIDNNKNIVYKRKSITKNKKINLHVYKKNFSMNYYININANLRNNNLNSHRKYKSNDNIEIKINQKPDLSNKNNKCGLITKKIIANKKEVLSKIIYIQKIWKQILNEKYQNMIYDYKEILNFIPHSDYSLKFFEKNKAINMSNASNFSNNISNTNNTFRSYNNKKNNIIKLLYKSYKYNIPPHLTFKNMNNYGHSYLNTTSIQHQGRNINNSNNILNTTYKYKINNNLSNIDNDILSYCNSNIYCNSNTIDNSTYNYTNPNNSKKKHKNCISFSSNNKKMKRIIYSTSIRNKLNKYVKKRIIFEYIPHSIDIYKHLRPNLNFISFNYENKEELLNLNNDKKNTISMPNISLMKKIKIKNKYKKSDNIKEAINKNKNIINNYFIEDYNDLEPNLCLENKLIMKKPISSKKLKNKLLFN